MVPFVVSEAIERMFKENGYKVREMSPEGADSRGNRRDWAPLF
jgi:predicted nuclease with RNAse H fold